MLFVFFVLFWFVSEKEGARGRIKLKLSGFISEHHSHHFLQ